MLAWGAWLVGFRADRVGIETMVLTLTLARWLGRPGCRGLFSSCQGVGTAKESSELKHFAQDRTEEFDPGSD